MPRGGKRTGAGRQFGSSVLEPLEAAAVAGECQRRWNADAQERLDAQINTYFKQSDYEVQVERVRQSAGKDPVALEDVEFARREMHGIDADDPRPAPRLVQFGVGVRYGLKRKITEEVAVWATAELGKRVTPGLVRTAWRTWGPDTWNAEGV